MQLVDIARAETKTNHSRRSPAPASANRPTRQRDGRLLPSLKRLGLKPQTQTPQTQCSPNRRPAKAVRSPTRRVIPCTSRRDSGRPQEFPDRPRENSRSLAARSTSDGFPANSILLRRQILPHFRNPPTARGRSRCAYELAPTQFFIGALKGRNATRRRCAHKLASRAGLLRPG